MVMQYLFPTNEQASCTGSSTEKTPVPRLQTPPPGKRKDQSKSETLNGDKKTPDTVKRKILEEEKVVCIKDDKKLVSNDFDPSKILDGFGETDEDAYPKEGYDYVKVSINFLSRQGAIVQTQRLRASPVLCYFSNLQSLLAQLLLLTFKIRLLENAVNK